MSFLQIGSSTGRGPRRVALAARPPVFNRRPTRNPTGGRAVRATRGARCVVILCIAILFLATTANGQQRRDKSPVLVKVNGTPITENQAALYRLIHHVPDDPSPTAHRKIVERLIENELMRQLLVDRRAEADPKRLAAAVEALKGQLRRKNANSDKTLRNLGFSDAALKRELFLPLAWDYHLGRVLTQSTLQAEFEKHRAEYDGTEVRASQIFLKLTPTDPASKAKEAEDKLGRLRAEIVAGKISFADAARRDSEAPSAANGGDVGYFAFRGTMPADVCRVVFALKKGDISQPFRTAFGVHLYTVTEIRPGNLSLEDVRSSVIRRLSTELWDRLIAQSRGTAKIEWQAGQP
jgi:parvulin-like peptidyl-prolyl isomerase